jgi:hypothetical protein
MAPRRQRGRIRNFPLFFLLQSGVRNLRRLDSVGREYAGSEDRIMMQVNKQEQSELLRKMLAEGFQSMP